MRHLAAVRAQSLILTENRRDSPGRMEDSAWNLSTRCLDATSSLYDLRVLLGVQHRQVTTTCKSWREFVVKSKKTLYFCVNSEGSTSTRHYVVTSTWALSCVRILDWVLVVRRKTCACAWLFCQTQNGAHNPCKWHTIVCEGYGLNF
jgi:hypothetical protein